MQISTGLKVLAGAVALAISAGASAQTTNAGSGGTIFVNVVDTTAGTSFMFDTGLTVASFADPTSYTMNLAALSTYQQFVATEKSGDNIDYSVVGAETPAGGTPAYISDVTGNATAAAINGKNAGSVAIQIGTFEGQILNPAGGSTFVPAGAASGTSWSLGGYEASVNSLIGTSDSQALGTSLGFYQIVATNATATRGGETSSTFAGTWDVSASGVLTYTEPGGTTVPLPTPLLLLVSGLGLMGVVARRGQSDKARAAA